MRPRAAQLPGPSPAPIRGFSATIRRIAIPLAVLAATAAACRPEASARPDLLLITVDSLRPDALHCYDPRTPIGQHICSLGDSGALYLWAIAPAPATAPSLGSLHSSRYPSEHEVLDGRRFLRERTITLAEQLASAGYHTAAVVSSPETTRALNFHQGFAHFDDHLPRRDRDGFATDRDAAATTDAALAWIEQAPRPWLLWVHYQDPHAPYAPPGTPRVEHWPLQRSGVGPATGEPWQRYLAEVAHVDAQVGRLLAELDRAEGRAEVVLAGDHGEAFGEEGVYFSHGHSVSLDQVHVPLLWRPVGPVAPRRLATPVSLLDVAPTLLAAAGLEIPDDFRGEPLILEEQPLGRLDVPRTLFAEQADRIAVISGNAYYSRARGGPIAIRDGALDPAQLRARAGRVASLPPGGDDAAHGSGAHDASPTGVARLLEPWLAAFERESQPAPPLPIDRHPLGASGRP